VQALGNWQQFVMAAFRLVNLGDFNPCPSLSIKSLSLFNVVVYIFKQVVFVLQ